LKNTEEVYSILNKLNISYKIIEHPPVYTVDETKEYVDELEGMKCKNLFLKNQKGNKHYLLITDHEKKINLKELAKILGEKGLGFASERRLKKYLGLTPGSVSPFGVINDENKEVIIIINECLKKEEKINFHPNINTETINLPYKDFEKFLKWSENEVIYIKLQ
jgi:Ala-tRNA(Pro) deacylase